MKIVKFKDGKYGIRKGFFGYKYYDLVSHIYWWRLDFKYMKDCKGTFDQCEKIYNSLTDKGEPIHNTSQTVSEE